MVGGRIKETIANEPNEQRVVGCIEQTCEQTVKAFYVSVTVQFHTCTCFVMLAIKLLTYGVVIII